MDDIKYSAAMIKMLPAPNYAVEPLYAAAYNGDIPAIINLANLKVNPNISQPSSGYTALHVAVFRCKLDSVVALLGYFRGILNLQKQDKKGDTALHIASRLGYVEITGAICDEESCDPCAVKNNEGKLPIDIVRSHKVFQIIKICQTRNELRNQLEKLQSLK